MDFSGFFRGSSDDYFDMKLNYFFGQFGLFLIIFMILAGAIFIFGTEHDISSARKYVDAIKQIKRRYPDCTEQDGASMPREE
jgi:hypothetical protein